MTLERFNYKLWTNAYKRLSAYGTYPPVACWSRLAAEEAALQGTDAIQGFAVTGLIREEAKKRNTAIIAAGTVNNSFTSWLFGGTPVNPLPPHYRCPACGRTEFVSGAADGFDLEPKICTCGETFLCDGHNLPYEGFAKEERDGTHVEYRVSKKFLPIATETLVRFYRGVVELLPVIFESTYNTQPAGVYRYVIVPEHKARPQVSEDGFWHVSTNDYWTWQNGETTFTFVVSDQLNRLEKLAKRKNVTLPDPNRLMTEQMKELLYQRQCEKFIERIRENAKPNFERLVQLQGFTHASFAWEENGELLVNSGRAKLPDIPATQEDIWNTVSQALRKQNILDNGLALMVMDDARKGRYSYKGLPQEVRQALNDLDIPEWYPEYLERVGYLFSKGQCIAQLQIDALYEWLALQGMTECANAED